MHYIGIPKHTQSMIAFWLSISGNFSENCNVVIVPYSVLVNTSNWQFWHQPLKRKVCVFVMGAWFLLINTGDSVFFVVQNQSTIHRSITAYNQLAPLGLWSEQHATDCAVMGDLSGGLELSGINIIKRAIELDSTKRYMESLICYQEGIQILMQAMNGVWLVGEH